jgi:hypothetical protein
MTIPKITQNHLDAAADQMSGYELMLDFVNKVNSIALAEQQSKEALAALPENLLPPESKKLLGDWIDSQQESEYITAAQARELGAGNAEYFQAGVWIPCDFDCSYLGSIKYRAIKAQSEPVDKHAELRAEYAKQVAEGTTKFYLWEYRDKHQIVAPWRMVRVPNFTVSEYRYTDISCMVAKQGEPAVRMLRAEAQELQRQTDETHEWRLPNGSYRNEMYANGKLTFTDKGTYTYAPKATIKLDGKMVTPEQAAAEWEVKKETHDLLFNDSQTKDWKMPVGLVAWAAFDSREIEYELRPKALKQVSWSDMPVGVMTNRGTFLKSSHGFAQVLTTDNPYCVSDVADYELELAPASEQPWIALQEGEDFHDTARKFLAAGLFYTFHANRYKITGIAEGYVLEGAI